MTDIAMAAAQESPPLLWNENGYSIVTVAKRQCHALIHMKYFERIYFFCYFAL
jgi:hypothetical protein